MREREVRASGVARARTSRPNIAKASYPQAIDTSMHLIRRIFGSVVLRECEESENRAILGGLFVGL
jgi:hypothetical protein